MLGAGFIWAWATTPPAREPGCTCILTSYRSDFRDCYHWKGPRPDAPPRGDGLSHIRQP